jgi:hypothetical protein
MVVRWGPIDAREEPSDRFWAPKPDLVVDFAMIVPFRCSSRGRLRGRWLCSVERCYRVPWRS